MLVNDLVDTSGITYAYRVTEDVGVGPVDAVRSYVATNAIFRIGEVWRQIRAGGRLGRGVRPDDAGPAPADRPRRPLAAQLPAAAAGGRRRDQPVRSQSRRADAADVGVAARRRPAIVEKEAGEFTSHGVPEDLAYMVATGLYQYSLLDIIDIADIVDREPAEVADTYFALMDHLGTDGLLTAVSRLARDDRWHSLARLAIRDDIYGSLRSLCFDVLAVGEPEESGEEKIAEWETTNSSRVQPARRTLNEIYESRRARPGDVVGGGASDPQHDTNEWNGDFWVTGDERLARRASSRAFVTSVPVRWSDIDMYQHINHATMVTILEEARIPFLREPFGDVIDEIGLLIHEVKILYKGQLRLMDSPLQVTMWSKRVRAVDFTIGYEVRSVQRADSKPAVIAETQLAAVHIKEQRLQRLSPAQQEYFCSAGCDDRKPERGIWLDDATHREDLATFVERALRLDDAAVIRLRERAGGLVVAWVATGFDVLASRVVAGRVRRPT